MSMVRQGQKKEMEIIRVFFFRDKRNAVKDFLKSFPGRESRNKSRKLYFPSEHKNISERSIYECFRKINL